MMLGMSTDDRRSTYTNAFTTNTKHKDSSGPSDENAVTNMHL